MNIYLETRIDACSSAKIDIFHRKLNFRRIPVPRKNITEIVIGILAGISIILVVIESLVSVSQSTLIGMYIADLIICIVFAVDFIRSFRVSESRSRFMKFHGFEILAMIPAFALYALSSIPAIAVALRSLRLIRVVRVIFLLARMQRFMSVSNRFIRRSNLILLFVITLAITFIGAYAALVFESGTENAEITNFSDAVWWSISTIATVGYGDIVPHSVAGRIMGMCLMFVGIGVMAAFVSQVSATLVESRMKSNAKKDDLRAGIISEIKIKLDNLDTLSESDVALLTNLIHTLRSTGDINEKKLS
jgi:voltage-gated potassium channel